MRYGAILLLEFKERKSCAEPISSSVKRRVRKKSLLMVCVCWLLLLPVDSARCCVVACSIFDSLTDIAPAQKARRHEETLPSIHPSIL